MAYNVVWADKALDDIASFDKKTARSVMDKVENYLAKEPLNLGKPLSGIFICLSLELAIEKISTIKNRGMEGILQETYY
ncbi:type II toxin-antitoxin system RelE family toxin [Candidatus Magnetominusculus dajiuhuensis]|uniref:type II toxin-antitoxin system RelE family toxin n=1 Tax=Candidatus Magnetominusculus dajiuhuensis TaxID=3137712 RepID=UPI003B4283EB